ncbi:hypothetical protein V1527DRAFT_495750 [Lipomyces starkeyi]
MLTSMRMGNPKQSSRIVVFLHSIYRASANGNNPGYMANEMVATRISSEIASGLNTESDSRTTMNRASDGTLLYWEGNRATLMIAVEIAVSQAYDSMRAAISWSVSALHCRLGLAMCISEESRGRRPPSRFYPSLEKANATVDEARYHFYHQLIQHPYGPLERDGVTWFGRVTLVHCTPETLLEPSQSFTLVENGEYVAQIISPNLREVVLGDCIPTHLLSNQHMEATPTQFKGSMVRTAILRV